MKIPFPPEKIFALIFGQDSVTDSAQNIWSNSRFMIPEKFDGEIATLRLDNAKDSYTSLNNSDWDFSFDREKFSFSNISVSIPTKWSESFYKMLDFSLD